MFALMSNMCQMYWPGIPESSELYVCPNPLEFIVVKPYSHVG